MTKVKALISIVEETVKKANSLYQDGTINEVVSSLDIMVAMLIDANRGVLRSRSREVMAYVVKFEEEAKYAKPVPEEVKELYRKKF